MTRNDLLKERAMLIETRKRLLAEEKRGGLTKAYSPQKPYGNWPEIRTIEGKLLYNTELLKLPIYSA